MKPASQRVRPRLFDVIEIPQHGRYAYLHYTHYVNEGCGALIRVIAGLRERTTDFAALVQAPTLFWCFYAAGSAIRKGIMRIVANVPPPPEFRSLPPFRHAAGFSRNGSIVRWRITGLGYDDMVIEELNEQQQWVSDYSIVFDEGLIQSIDNQWTPRDDYQRGLYYWRLAERKLKSKSSN